MMWKQNTHPETIRKNAFQIKKKEEEEEERTNQTKKWLLLELKN
jgi:hypothetical protein